MIINQSQSKRSYDLDSGWSEENPSVHTS